MVTLASFALAIALQSPSGFVATRYELSERLKRLDVAWMAAPDSARRSAAIDPLHEAVKLRPPMRMPEAAQALDDATARLENRRLRPSDALNVRPATPFCEPGATVNLKITWEYPPSSVLPVTVGVGSQQIDVKAGQTASLSVNPWLINPESPRLNREVGFLLPIRVGSDQRYVYVSFVRKLNERLNRLKGLLSSFVSDTAKLLEGFQNNPSTMETELPLIQLLFNAEAVEDGKTKVSDFESIYYARHKNTVLRAMFPKEKPDGPINVVVAVHGAGGSENMFFESYGRGLAASEAVKRGWAFVAPRAGSTCVNDALDWVSSVRGVTIGKVFLLGHSMGGGVVLSGKFSVVPAAVAAFAPAALKVSDDLASVPLYVAVGKQESVLRSGGDVGQVAGIAGQHGIPGAWIRPST